MPIAFDPYAFLQYERQKTATGRPGLSPAQLEQLGYGVTGAMAVREAGSRDYALRERAQVASEEAQRRQEERLSSQLQSQQIASLVGGIGSLGTGAASIEYLTRGKMGEPGWISRGYGAVKEAVTGGVPPAPKPPSILFPGAPAAVTLPSAGYMAGSQAAALTGAPGTAITAGGAVVNLPGAAVPSAAAPSLGTSITGAPIAAPAAAGWVGGKVGKEIIPFGGEKERAVMGGVTAGATTGGMIGGPAGAVVGGIVGGISAYASETVICTELLRQGRVTKEMLQLEKIYQPRFDPDTYWGYRMWADPVVRRMRHSRLLSFLMGVLGRAFLKEVAHRVEPQRKRSILGSLILKIGVPLCRWNYRRLLKRLHKLERAFFGEEK